MEVGKFIVAYLLLSAYGTDVSVHSVHKTKEECYMHKAAKELTNENNGWDDKQFYDCQLIYVQRDEK